MLQVGSTFLITGVLQFPNMIKVCVCVSREREGEREREREIRRHERIRNKGR